MRRRVTWRLTRLQTICNVIKYRKYFKLFGTVAVRSVKIGHSTSELRDRSFIYNHNHHFILFIFQIIFEAIRGPRDTTDMAIDDVMVGPCETFAGFQDAVIRESKQGAIL